MDVVARTALTGTAAEIEAKAREAVRLAPDDELAGTRLRDLSVVLAANPLLHVTVVTYTAAQGLEVLLRGAPQRDAVTVHVYRSGAWCRIVWDTLAPVSTSANIASTAGLVTTILHTGRQSGLRHDPLDPQRILGDLPESEQGIFLAEYRRALDGARDPKGWEGLGKVLRLWRFRAAVANDPGYWQAREEARTGTGGGMTLEDYLRQRRGADEQ
jgi:hypothetical protein